MTENFSAPGSSHVQKPVSKLRKGDLIHYAGRGIYLRVTRREKHKRRWLFSTIEELRVHLSDGSYITSRDGVQRVLKR
jgi:hypothetical protein